MKIPKEIIIRELSKDVDIGASSLIYFKSNKQRFSGQLEGESFEIVLKTSYKNSFKPQIKITFYEFDNNTEIHIDYKLHSFVKVFMSFFISILLIIQTLIAYHILSEKFSNFDYFYIFPLGMIVFLLVFSKMGFYMSLGHSESVIKKILIRTKRNYNTIHN